MIKIVFVIGGFLCSNLIFSQEKENSFKLCDSVGVWPYYNPDLTIEGNFWEAKEHYKKDYPLSLFQTLKNNTGIITVQFKVNCKGETGDFSIQQCNFNYQPTVMAEQITGYFLSQSKTLTGWIPGKDEEANVVNHHKFFSFRIKEGELIQILPK
ncbi:MAG: hypothetical protein ACPGSL_03980 [Vicingaceae bacterium]